MHPIPRLQLYYRHHAVRNYFLLGLALDSSLISNWAWSAEWKSSASISASGTLTDNVNLSPSGQKTDFISSITPSISTQLDGARLKVHASYAPTLNTYAATSENDYVAHTLSAFAGLEAVEKFFYVDSTATIAQTYVSPFAPQPLNTTSATANRTQTTSLGLSPYIKSTTPSGIAYLVRNDNFYTTSNTSGLSDSYNSQITAKVDGPPGTMLVWGGDYNYTYTKFEPNPPFRSQVGRLRLAHALDPEITVSASGGYERNNYGVSNQQGMIYGAGFIWAPTLRTNVYGNWEHRFFGESYSAGFNHRTRLTAWNLQASRNISTSASSLTVPVGNTQASLNAIFQSRIPDPVERQQAVDAFIQKAGLPSSLVSPLSFYANQIYLIESVNGTFALVGARNTLAFGAFWSNNKPITSSGQTLPSSFLGVSNFVTEGASVTLSHQVSAFTSLALTGTHTIARSEDDNTSSTGTPKSTGDTYVLSMSHQFSPKTYASFGLRYQTFESTGSSRVKEQAALASVTHTF